MKPSSAKAKGRRLQNAVAEIVAERFGLDPADVKPAIMGESGVDVHLSAAAREAFPFAVECKNVERLNIWKALEQAEENAERGVTPLVIFKRNRSLIYCALAFEDLFKLLGDE